MATRDEVQGQERAEAGASFGKTFVLTADAWLPAGFVGLLCGASGRVPVTGGNVLSCHSRPTAPWTIHTGTKPFKCFECGQTFRWVSAFCNSRETSVAMRGPL